MARGMLVVCPARGSRARALCLVTFVTAMVGAGVSSRRAFGASADDQQLALAGAGAVKIVVRGAGWVRVGQPALVAAGLSRRRRSGDAAALRRRRRAGHRRHGQRRQRRSPRTRRSSSTASAAIRSGPTRARTGWWRGGVGRARPRRRPGGPPRCARATFVRTERVAERKVYLASVRERRRQQLLRRRRRRRRPRWGRSPRLTSTPVNAGDAVAARDACRARRRRPRGRRVVQRAAARHLQLEGQERATFSFPSPASSRERTS